MLTEFRWDLQSKTPIIQNDPTMQVSCSMKMTEDKKFLWSIKELNKSLDKTQLTFSFLSFGYMVRIKSTHHQALLQHKQQV
jgi:hypothetical protein